MHPVGADDEIEPLARAVGQLHLHATRVLRDGINGDREPRLDSRADPMVEQALEVAHEVELPVVEQPSKTRIGDPKLLAPTGVEEPSRATG